MSIDHLKEKAKRDKKVILVVTDGNDNASTMSLDALVRLAQQDDVLVYAIGLLGGGREAGGGQGEARSGDTGGKYRRPGLLPEGCDGGGQDRT